MGRNRVLASAIGLALGAAMAVVATQSAQASGNQWFDKYVAMDAAVGDSLYQSPDSATLGWGESYILESFLDVYRVSGDTHWLDRVVTHVDRLVANADDDDGDGYLGWQTARYSPVEISNGGMETAASGDSTLPASWTRFQTTSANAFRTTDRAAGAYAVRIDSDGQLWRKVYQRMNTYEPNTVYTLQLQAKTNGSAAGGRAYVHDRTTDQILCSIVVTSTAWKFHSTECRAPAAAGHQLEVWLGHNDYRVAGGRAFYDEVRISGQFPYLVHDGMVGTAMAHFVKLVQQTPPLHTRYLGKATSYRTFLETELVPRWESSAYIGNTWVSLSSTTGTYQQSPRFDAFSHTRNWTYLPYNQSLAYTRMLLVLHEVNGNATYLDRARRNGQYFKNALTLSGDDYVWKYAYYSSGAEDVSHANLDVGAARELYQRGIVFTATDMQRFTNTLTTRMWNGSVTAPTVKKYVDGTGDTSYSRYLVEWAEYAQWAKAIFSIVGEQYRNSTTQGAYDMLALARVMKWDRAKLVNQSFELATSFDATQPAQWNRVNSTATTMFRDSANAYSGSYGLTVKATGGTAQLASQSWEGWRAGTSYTLTFVGKTDGTAAGGLVYVKNETSGAVLASVPFTGTAWTPLSATFTSPATASDVVRVYIGNRDATVVGSAHVDDIKIRGTTDPW